MWDVFPTYRRLGGAAANLAYHAAALGVESVLISAVGADAFGDEALEVLRRARVETRYIRRHPVLATGIVKVELAGGEPLYSIASVVAWDAIGWQDELGALLTRAKVFTFGTLAQRTLGGRRSLERTLSALPETTLRLCDLNLRPPFVDVAAVSVALEHADVVKLNLDECRALDEMFGVCARSARRSVERQAPIAAPVIDWLLDEHGVKLVLLTRGAAGSVLATREGTFDHPGVPCGDLNGDPVGAGDAFSAVIAAEIALRGVPGLAELGPLSERANRYASGVASSRGAVPDAASSAS